MKKIVLVFVIMVLVFIGFHEVNNKKDNKALADRFLAFNEKTVKHKKLVFYDNKSFYRVYYVVNFTDNNNYIMNGYYFLERDQDYFEVYRNVLDMIIDYNYDELTIRTCEQTGKALYDDFVARYQDLFDSGSYIIVY